MCAKNKHNLLWLAVLDEAPVGRRFMFPPPPFFGRAAATVSLLPPWTEWGQSKTQSQASPPAFKDPKARPQPKPHAVAAASDIPFPFRFLFLKSLGST